MQSLQYVWILYASLNSVENVYFFLWILLIFSAFILLERNFVAFLLMALCFLLSRSHIVRDFLASTGILSPIFIELYFDRNSCLVCIVSWIFLPFNYISIVFCYGRVVFVAIRENFLLKERPKGGDCFNCLLIGRCYLWILWYGYWRIFSVPNALGIYWYYKKPEKETLWLQLTYF